MLPEWIKLRNPGWISVLMFAIAASIVIYLTHSGTPVPEALKIAAAVLAIAVPAFAGKSVVTVDPSKRPSSRPPPPTRKEYPTWPEIKVPPVVDVPVTIEDPEDETTKPSEGVKR